MRDPIKFFLLTILFLGLMASQSASVKAAPMPAPQQLAAQVVAEINAYRQANGFSALPVNGLLASLAQAQSEHQASIESVTHTGPGGTTPRERAAAAGYAGGGTFFMSEIIYGGYNATPAAAINWWKNSALHNSVLLDSRYAELGAGVAYNGDRVYFTVELAWTGSYIAYDGIGGDSAGTVGGLPGGSSSSSGSASGDSGSATSAVTPATAASVPITRVEPNADGSVIHIVQAGQTLWTIAAVYEVELQQLYDLNQLNAASLVFPGDQIIIQPPTTDSAAAASTPTTENTATAQPSPTARPPQIGEAFSFVPPATATLPPVETQAAAAVPTPAQAQTSSRSAQWLLIASGVIILSAVVGSMLLSRPAKPSSRDDV